MKLADIYQKKEYLKAKIEEQETNSTTCIGASMTLRRGRVKGESVIWLQTPTVI
jgi:hypothetical protein